MWRYSAGWLGIPSCVTHRLKCSTIFSSRTCSGKFPTQRCLVSRTILSVVIPVYTHMLSRFLISAGGKSALLNKRLSTEWKNDPGRPCWWVCLAQWSSSNPSSTDRMRVKHSWWWQGARRAQTNSFDGHYSCHHFSRDWRAPVIMRHLNPFALA